VQHAGNREHAQGSQAQLQIHKYKELELLKFLQES
jgi:hypothetical protein